MSYALLFISYILLFVYPAHGSETPTPSSHPVIKTQKELESKKGEKVKLDKELKSIKSTLQSTRSDVVQISARAREIERELTALDEKMREQQQEKDQISERLNLDKTSMSKLILALSRLRNTPPEALILKPDAPLKTAQTSIILESTLPRIYARAQNFKEDIKRLETVLAELQENKRKIDKKSKILEKDQRKLRDLLKKREKLYAKTEKNRKQTQKEIALISAQAKSLKDLVKQLDEYEAPKAFGRKLKAPKFTKSQRALFKNAQMPVTGKIKIAFGSTDSIQARSEGIHFQGRRSGLVISPLDGVIRFTGPFKNYGNMIIIEHDQNYHSLIAGLKKIDTLEGRRVSAGEAVGTLSSTGDDDDLEVYYELRFKGKPVDPMILFGRS